MDAELHDDQAHEAITAELVRCTLTGAHRPELVMRSPLADVLQQIGQAYRRVMDDAMASWRAAFRAGLQVQRPDTFTGVTDV